MSTITAEQEQAIRAYVDSHELPQGLGTAEAACSIAAINLALSGHLTDSIPECMSKVIGNWIIRIQDSMPGAIRNSPEWKSLLPLAAGTGREHEQERLAIILDWMWGTVLPQIQSIADAHGFGAMWREMCEQRTYAASYAASSAAYAASSAASAAAAAARAVANAAAAADGGAAAAVANAAAAAAGGAAAAAANAAAADVGGAGRWTTCDPAGLLARLIAVGEQ